MGSTGISANPINEQTSSRGFKEGDTAKAVREDGVYRVSRLMADDTERDYGTLPGTDVKLLVKGYKFNGLFWQKSGVKNILIVEEVE